MHERPFKEFGGFVFGDACLQACPALLLLSQALDNFTTQRSAQVSDLGPGTIPRREQAAFILIHYICSFT